MANPIKITYDDRSVRAFLDQLPERLASKAVLRALNKVPANVRTAASKAIRERRPLPAGVVRQAMGIRRATKAIPVSILSVTGRPIPLRDYQARPTKKGVTVAVTKGQRKLVRHKGNAAFIIEGKGGHVFARETSARLPIKKLYGPSLPSTFVQDRVKAAWLAVAKDAMVKRLNEEVQFELSKGSKG